MFIVVFSLLLAASPAGQAAAASFDPVTKLALIDQRFLAASETANRTLILCLEPKLRLAKTLVHEFAAAGAQRRGEIQTDLESLDLSSQRCLALRTAVR